MEISEIRERIEQLVDEEHHLLREHVGEGLDPERHARLGELTRELDEAWDLLRRREAGQGALSDSDVPDPPNEFEDPDPEADA